MQKEPYSFKDYSSSLKQEVDRYKLEQLLNQDFSILNSNLYSDYNKKDININDKLSLSQKKMIEDSIYMQGILLSNIGLLFILPESISKWDLKSADSLSLSQRWKKNVNAGPVIDEDEDSINYIGHPVSGAWYYTMARNDGLDPFESFLFSSFVSTFVWEYGYESFAEIPSIQDILSTPLLGSILGEYFFYLENRLDKSNGLIWGWKSLGNVSYFLLNPIGNITTTLSDLFDINLTMKFQTYQKSNNIYHTDYNKFINKPEQFTHFNYGVIFNFEY